MLLRGVEVADGGDGRARSRSASYPLRIRRTSCRVDPPVLHAERTFPELIDTMKKAAAALRDAEVPFLLGGGLAAWARGGPPTDHDVDFLVRERTPSARSRRSTRRACGPSARPRAGSSRRGTATSSSTSSSARPAARSTTSYFERATALEVAALPLLVASIDDVLATKLLAMSEQAPDYRPVLEIARSLREQIDWDFVRAQVEDAPVRRRVLHARRAPADPARAAVASPSARGVNAYDARYERLPRRDARMPMWAWILIIVLLVLLVTGGVGYGRR